MVGGGRIGNAKVMGGRVACNPGSGRSVCNPQRKSSYFRPCVLLTWFYLTFVLNQEMSYLLPIGIVLLSLSVRWLNFSWFTTLVGAFLVYLVSGGWRFVRVFCLTFPRDFR